VLVANTAEGDGTAARTSDHTRLLSSTLSGMASITRSQPASASTPAAVLIRANAASAAAVASSSDTPPFFTALAAFRDRLPLIRAMALSAASGNASTPTTLNPASAAVCTMPWPIRPMPTTPTCEARAGRASARRWAGFREAPGAAFSGRTASPS